MRRLADVVVSWLLQRTAWYKPDEIEQREARSEAAHQQSIDARISTERAIGPSRLAAYRRVRIGR